MVPVLNDKLVPQGLARLTSAFINQPNIRALLAAYLQPLQDVEFQLWNILQARVLSTATIYSLPQTNSVFDSIGALVGLARTGLSDVDYRALIYLEIAVNRTTGRMSDWSRFAQILAPWSDAVQFVDGDNADFQFGVWNIQLPAIIVGAQLARATENGVGGVFAFTTWEDTGDDLKWAWSGDMSGTGQSGWGWSGDTATGGVWCAGFAL